MIRLSATDVRCVIFASALQQSDSPSADIVAAAVSSVLADLGLTGCLGRMAQEFGDHPDAACERMRWAGRLSGAQEAAGLELAG
ncbi:MAG: hypothetical protein ACRDOK_28665 [Streptosporangiaceae bacterium]